jgi:WXXGXW repeat (2 copies)
MLARCGWVPLGALFLCLGALPGRGQEAAPPPPPTPEGVEVQARGPVHEAFAGPTSEAVATPAVPKQPPAAIEELPPAEKPDGNMIWISGYWAYDDDRKDFLWVSGTWRAAPPGKQWVAGYWREQGTDWQWVPGFWSAGSKSAEQSVTYLPAPPAAPKMAAPPKPPSDDLFYIPGTWVWNGSTYAWRGPQWSRIQPGYVWVPDHFSWTPAGYVYVQGYWDLPLKSRGMLYAPVVISPSVITVGFVYTPAYAVRDTVVVDAMFIRPTTCHYYFGDYYGPSYQAWGYQSCVVYSASNYDGIIVYERYERRRDPTWITFQVNVYNDRYAGRAVCPPRTLVQQQQIINSGNTTINNTTINNTTVNNINMIAPPAQVAAAKSTTMVKIDDATRQQARVQAVAVQQVAQQRVATEKPLPPGAPRQARVASFSVPQAQPVRPGMVAPRVVPRPASTPTATPAVRPAGMAPATTASRPGVNTTPPPTGIQPVSSRVPGQPTPQGLRPGTAAAPTHPATGRPSPLLPQRQPPPKRPPDKKEKPDAR